MIHLVAAAAAIVIIGGVVIVLFLISACRLCRYRFRDCVVGSAKFFVFYETDRSFQPPPLRDGRRPLCLPLVNLGNNYHAISIKLPVIVQSPN